MICDSVAIVTRSTMSVALSLDMMTFFRAVSKPALVDHRAVLRR
jgi:hypothetical protein